MVTIRLRRPASAARRLPVTTGSILFSFFVFMLAELARAASGATLAGGVTDPDGRGVASARVIVTNALGTVTGAVTDSGGQYEITSLAAGQYDVRVVADGFQADPIGVTLAADERREVNVQLRISAVTESLVVSASQIEVPLSRAADSVTVITAAELQAGQFETVSDALRLVPGLSVTRSGGRGAITSLFPRGGGSNYTLVLVDGMRVNDFGGGYDFAHLSVADVDRIEIVRGPESALFGSDAIGAVVQIVTKRGGPTRVDGLVEGGGQGTTRSTVSAAGSRGEWSWGGGAERTESDGYTGAAADGERVSNDDYHLAHASGTLGWQRANGPDVLISANIGRDERGFPGPFGSDPIHVFSGVDRVSRGVDDTRQIGVRVTHPWSAQIRQRVEANYTDLSGDFASPFGPSTSGTRRFDGRIQEDVAFSPALGASAGVELMRERGSSSLITGSTGETIPIERNVTGAYGEVRAAGGDRLFVTAGVRLEHLTRNPVEPDPNGFPPRPAFPSQTIDSLNPKIAVSYMAARPGRRRAATRLRASAGTGIRSPNAFEIAFTDNPGLRPERSRSFDAGVEQQLAGGAYNLGATAFFNRYEDLIVTIGDSLRGASPYRTDNVSNARARGVELTGDARLPSGFAVHGNYTFLATEILSVDGLSLAPVPFSVGDPLIRRPRHQGALDLVYASARLSAFAELTSRSRVLDLEPNFASSLFFTPGYSVINAGVTVPVVRGVQMIARVLNLADRAYEETLGYPAMRRSGLVGVRIAWHR
jgi:outer membrane cobalamin receptor